MNVLEAHAMFASRRDEGLGTLPEGISLRYPVVAPAAATACCVLTGGLELATTDRDLDDLGRGFALLWAAGVVTPDSLNRATLEVINSISASEELAELDATQRESAFREN